MVALYAALVLGVAMQRIWELQISRRHTRWARAQGGIEFGSDHFRWMRILHATFLIACVVEVAVARKPFDPAIGLPMLALLALAQGLRLWTMRTLGPLWNARVIVVPGHPRVRGGPYRFLRHPNYLAVAIEIVALPMIGGAWRTALLFTLLNGWLLAVRIRCEEQALGALAHGPRTPASHG